MSSELVKCILHFAKHPTTRPMFLLHSHSTQRKNLMPHEPSKALTINFTREAINWKIPNKYKSEKSYRIPWHGLHMSDDYTTLHMEFLMVK